MKNISPKSANMSLLQQKRSWAAAYLVSNASWGSSITNLLLLLGWLLLALLLRLGGAQEGSLGSIDACYDKNQSLNGLLSAG